MTPKQSVSQPSSDSALVDKYMPAFDVAEFRGAVHKGELLYSTVDVARALRAALAEPAVHLPDLGIAQGHVAVPASEEKRDAERYRWLRRHASALVSLDDDDGMERVVAMGNEALDAAIDAALAPAGPSKPGQGAGGSGQDEQGDSVEDGRQEGAK